MGKATGIEWADHTFNPVWGCVEVSPACDNCYAKAWDKRVGGDHWGPHAPLREFGPKHWAEPFRWDKAASEAGKRARVFCASMADVFDNRWPERIRGDLWAVIRSTPNLDWMLLTKRPQNIAKMLPADWGNGYANVWLGVTAENQAEANRRITKLLDISAVLHFISAEPLLGPLDLTAIDCGNWTWDALRGVGMDKPHVAGFLGYRASMPIHSGRRIRWVIAGGERGPRPAHPDWFRSLRDQCAAAGVAFMLKQWGDWIALIDRDRDDPDWRADYTLTNRKPKHHRILNLAGGFGFSGERVHMMKRVGKQAAGRTLDGRIHSEFPQ